MYLWVHLVEGKIVEYQNSIRMQYFINVVEGVKICTNLHATHINSSYLLRQ